MAKRLDVGIDSVKKVIHVADIHIRNVKRHQEFRQVFQNFYDDLDRMDLTDTVIYIGGDIAHSKTDMSPELVHEISEFLTEVSRRAFTILILGNHDCSLNNMRRLDVLSPIVKSLNLPSLYYMKDSETIVIGDTSFTTFSILDDAEIYPTLIEYVPSDIANKIVFHHGPVHDSETDVGYVIKNRAVQADAFNGYDIAMLGDIHRHQVLRHYNEERGVPIIAYVGSMVQQNHGESLNNHGYMIWDVPNRSFEFVELENDYGYATLYINEGKLSDIDRLPKKPRLRVRVVKTDSTVVKDIIKSLKTKFNVEELTLTRIDTLDSEAITDMSSRLSIGDVSDPNYQNQLISDYLKANFIVDEEDVSMIQKINLETNMQIVESSIPRNIQWVPIRFEFDNMFSYAEGNVIEFTQMQDLVGLFAPNRSGKSSIADAISFCLFDKTSRAFKAIDIMNSKKDDFWCKFEFDINGTRYFIEKKASRVRKNTAVRVDVVFWREQDGKKISMNGDQRRETNDVIRQHVGTYETFVLTTLSVQGKNSQFIDKSQSERKDLLSEFMGTSIFDRLYTVAYDEVRTLRSQVKKFNKDGITDLIVENEATLKSKKEEYEQKKVEHADLISERDVLMDELLELNQQLYTIDASITDVTALKTARDAVANTISKKTSELISLEKKFKEISKELAQLKESMKNMMASDIQTRIEAHNSLVQTLALLQKEQQHIQSEKESKLARVGQVDALSFDPECDICMSNESKLNKEAVELREDIVKLGNRLTELKNHIEAIEDEIDYSVEGEYQIYNDLKETLNEKEMWCLRHESKIDGLKYEIDGLKRQQTELNGKIEKYYEMQSIIKENQQRQEDIAEIKETVDNLKSLIQTTNDEIMTLHGEISSIEAKLSEYENRLAEVSGVENDLRLHELYIKCVKRDGIPYELISKVVPVIEGEINNILQQIVDFGIVLHMDGKNINAHLVYDDEAWLLDLASGMERFVSGLAIRIALMNVCNLPRSNFIIIDEGMGTLDAENLSTFYLVFDYLKTHFDFIILISHLDTARDMVDDLIEVKKERGFSKVVYVK